MSHPLSTLGVIHTAVSLIPVLSGLYAFIRHRAIDPATRAGKLYLVGLVLSVATSFTVSSMGGINPGHAFGGIVLLVAFGGVLAARLRWLGRAAPYASTFALSFSFLLSLVPGVNETLTRVPAAHPIAAAPMAPVVLHTLLGLAAVFVIGVAAQCWRLRNRALAGRS
ncbi:MULTISPECIES: hypothetical protein [Stenotrophomonas]|uniref:hypothetical protein n=1 Tax=Stenotrophomonas TaxID=40323 RepID=UPI00066DC1DE|nr:hypothetical protein [Stenotrophomonas maltophilia]EKU9964209.1 hypothetical protein [Stenotrophomonas maltophilia]MBA0337865.1 hypothetical protein [Stenotrophomonas maltophilia]MBA0541761.1 hypothetical protein [Stenotrophomonas maltophilia]MBH1428849.1 hypothetical protein [Stenotrophomonas maltophilia]MBH1457954.1 hypothetical protein [Stenotrophomonas maltophilia]